jgi:uncharacterized protein with FMN-binding domain
MGPSMGISPGYQSHRKDSPIRTRAVLSSIFASATILIVGWQAGAAMSNTGTVATSRASTTATTGRSSTPPNAPAPAAAAKPVITGTFSGASVSTQFGDVQVELVVAAGKITDVKTIHLTDNGGRSIQISNYAAPILRSEVLQSQSARVSAVSGATYTSGAYLSSLQSAIDQAGL